MYFCLNGPHKYNCERILKHPFLFPFLFTISYQYDTLTCQIIVLWRYHLKLIIAEKPSVAKSIASALGVTSGADG